MRYRSHMDPVLLVPFVHIDWALLPETNRIVDDDFAMRLGDHVRSDDALLHEWFHYWQFLSLPFLRYFSSEAIRRILSHAFDVRRESGSVLQSSPEMGDQLDVPFQQFSFGQTDAGDLGVVYGNVQFVARHGGVQTFVVGEHETLSGVRRISTVDIIEAAACFGEWQLRAARRRPENLKSYRHYERWTKRNPAYVDALQLACDFLGPPLAHRAFLPCVTAAFEMTHPVLGFFLALWATKRMFSQFEWVPLDELADLTNSIFEEFTEVLRGYLGQIAWQLVDFPSRWNHNVVMRIPTDQIPSHPLLENETAAWEDFSKGTLASLLHTQPGRISHDLREIMMSRHQPPVSIVVLDGLPEATRRRLGSNKILTGHPDGLLHHQKSEQSFLFQFASAVYGVVRNRLKLLHNPEVSYCHHRDCPRWSAGDCNAFIFYPPDWQHCLFPVFVKGAS